MEPFLEDGPFSDSGVARDPKRLNMRYKTMFAPIVSLFKDANVLELGSHNGRWSYVCLLHGAKKVIGVEKDKTFLELSSNILGERFNRNRFEFIEGDCEEFPKFVQGKFDIILCMGILYYLQSPLKILEEIANFNPKICILDTFHTDGNVPSQLDLELVLDKYFLKNLLLKYDDDRRLSYHCWNKEKIKF